MTNFQIGFGQSNLPHSLKKRYFYKLATNIVGFCASLITQAVIPRGLGPRAYGDFNFLTNFFNQMVGFFDMGSSLGFYTKLSQRQKEFKLVSFYFYFIGVVTFLIIAFVIFVRYTNIYMKLWPDQGLVYIYLALFLGILVWVNNVTNQIVDAYGLTVPAEIGKIFQKLIGLLIVIGLFLYKKLNLMNIFFYNYFLLFLLIIIFIKIMKQCNYSSEDNWKLTLGEIKKYIKEFYKYCHPLFVYSLVGMLVAIFDRWLLQVCGGSLQQGFFGLSYQIGAICFLFTSAMTPLIMREFSIAYDNKDLSLMKNIFCKYIPLFYSITSFLACFIAVNANKVTIIMGGGKFKEATLAVAIMAFYPIHQTYGQLSGSVFYATGQTKLYRNIGVFFMLVGLPVTYFLIAPKNLLGLNAGANGLAIKMVLIQFFAVNVQLYFNAKFLNFSFFKYLGHQVLNLINFLSIAAFATFITNHILRFSKNIVFSFIIGGLLYILLSAIFIYFFPIVFGLERGSLRSLTQYFIERIKRQR